MLTHKVHLSRETLFQELGGEGVILDLASSRYFGLDEVGARLWQQLLQDPSLQAACDRLLAEFEVEASRLEQDVLALVEQLLEAGLVSVE